MSSQLLVASNIVMAVALVAGVAGTARADGSSVSRFGADGYVYFHQDRPVVSKARSEFRQTNQGLSVSYYQGLSSWGPEWHPAPDIDKAGSRFAQRNPKGISFSEYQASSSNSSKWQLQSSPGTTSAAPTNAPDVGSRTARPY